MAMRRARKWIPPAGGRLGWTWTVRAGRAVPFVTTATFFPPPAFDFLNPNPLATIVRPLPALDRERREQEGMFVAVIGNSLADDKAGIADRGRRGQNLEIALGKIAQRIEIEHLVFGVEKRVRRVVVRSGRPDNHSERVAAATAGNAIGRAGISTERAQIGHTVTELRVSSAETEEKEEYCGEDFVFRFHNGSSLI